MDNPVFPGRNRRFHERHRALPAATKRARLTRLALSDQGAWSDPTSQNREPFSFPSRSSRRASPSPRDAATTTRSGSGGGGDSTLTLVAYTTPREVYEEVIPAFQATPAGEGIDFEQSYGPSGDQSRAVEAGARRRRAGAVAGPRHHPPRGARHRQRRPGTTAPPRASSATRSWSSPSARATPRASGPGTTCVKDGVEVITPNPFTSGGAQWNIGAAYGAQLEQGKSKQEALEYIQQLFENVPVQPKGARESLQVFTAGKGDVLLAYENEAITAQQAGEPVEYVIPEETILIQNPIAATSRAATPTAAKAFVDYALTRAGPGDLRREGVPLGQPGRRQGERRDLPRPARALHGGRAARRLEVPSRTSSSSPTRASWPTSSPAGGSPKRMSSADPQRPAPPGVLRSGARGRLARDGHRGALHEHHRADPAGGPDRRRLRRGLERVLGRDHQRAGAGTP